MKTIPMIIILIIFMVMSNRDNHDTFTLLESIRKCNLGHILNTFFQDGVSIFVEIEKKYHTIIFLNLATSESPGFGERNRVWFRPDFKEHNQLTHSSFNLEA